MSLIAISSPVFVVALARIFLGEPLTLRRVVGILLAGTGIILLATKGKVTILTELKFSTGDFWMLVAAVAFAAYSVLVKYKPNDLSQIAFLASIIVLGLIFLIPWVLWENLYDGKLELSFRVIMALAYLGLGPSIIAFLCWNRAVLEIGPTRTAFIYYSLPVFSGLEAYLFLDEPVDWIHILSGMLIIIAIALATLNRNARAST
jgi:drug/metabolite transporter (DMT)-like permease